MNTDSLISPFEAFKKCFVTFCIMSFLSTTSTFLSVQEFRASYHLDNALFATLNFILPFFSIYLMACVAAKTYFAFIQHPSGNPFFSDGNAIILNFLGLSCLLMILTFVSVGGFFAFKHFFGDALLLNLFFSAKSFMKIAYGLSTIFATSLTMYMFPMLVISTFRQREGFKLKSGWIKDGLRFLFIYQDTSFKLFLLIALKGILFYVFWHFFSTDFSILPLAITTLATLISNLLFWLIYTYLLWFVLVNWKPDIATEDVELAKGREM